jgi:hypothetical protein
MVGLILHDNGVTEKYHSNIDGYNCKELAEYIADKSPRYQYAEHRYEWLCVHEQIKEFQG